MGFKELLVILVIALVIFGTKRLRNMGGDLGGAVKNFKDAMNGEAENKPATAKRAPTKRTNSPKTTARKPAAKAVKKAAPRKAAAK